MAHAVRILNLASFSSVEEFEQEIADYLDRGWELAESGASGAGDSSFFHFNYYVIMVRYDD